MGHQTSTAGWRSTDCGLKIQQGSEIELLLATRRDYFIIGGLGPQGPQFFAEVELQSDQDLMKNPDTHS